jgi:GAF domain-containing protein
MGGAETLIAIARTLTTEPDLTETLRRVAREIAHFTGAETVAVYLLDQAGRVLSPIAAYRVPKDTLPILSQRPAAAHGRAPPRRGGRGRGELPGPHRAPAGRDVSDHPE